MRLLSAQHFTFHEFPEDASVPYAILSHTWDGHEVTLQDMQQPNSRHILQSKNLATKSWKKIQDACSMARRKGFLYIWIDSCCIDKTNSAELQEAINSMFRWYRNSGLCLALLSDVDKSEFELIEDLQSYATLISRWFTRGWTLQELLAPDDLFFFDVNWNELGSRSQWASHISKATGIHVKFLHGIELKLDPYKSWDVEAALRDTSVATKMSWAAGRETTRMEDQAYCLLGLFDIHMPMLYGEGTKAFARLQQEIMKSTDDCTLLAWGYNYPLLGAPVSQIPFFCDCCTCDTYHGERSRSPSPTSDFPIRSRPMPLPVTHLSSCAYADVGHRPLGGALARRQLYRDVNGHTAGGRPRSLFATSPHDFRFAGNLESCGIRGHKRPTFAMSQRGLEITLPIVKDESHQHIVYGLLACTPKSKTKQTSLVAIPLIRASVIDAASEDYDDEYVQSPFCLPCKVPLSFAERAERMSICIRHEDRYRRLWDSAGYSERSLIFDFGHPLATKKDDSALRVELMYPSQPLCSIYFNLFRHSCPVNLIPCAPVDTLKPSWWMYHVPRPPPRLRLRPTSRHPWDENVHKKVVYAPDTTVAAVVLNFDPFPREPDVSRQTRILLVVSSDLSCRVRKLEPDKEVTLRNLMTIAQRPDLAGPKLQFNWPEKKEYEWWKEARVDCQLPDGIELCLRTWY